MIAFQLKKLTDCTERDFVRLSELDRKLFLRYGATFADEYWHLENFRLILPGKFERSIVVRKGRQIAGFCIASEKGNYLYIHRFVTDPDCKLEKPGDAVFASFHAMNGDFRNFALVVSSTNIPAITFYQKQGFSLITGNFQLKRIAAILKSDLPSLTVDRNVPGLKNLMVRSD